MAGLRAAQAGEILDVLDIAILRAHRQDAGEGAKRHDEIDRHVDGDALDARDRARGEPDERKTHMADGRIGHQPLDVALADGRKGAERHRGDRDEDHDLLPLGQDRRESRDHDTDRHAMAAILGAEAKNAVTGVGAPS